MWIPTSWLFGASGESPIGVCCEAEEWGREGDGVEEGREVPGYSDLVTKGLKPFQATFDSEKCFFTTEFAELLVKSQNK